VVERRSTGRFPHASHQVFNYQEDNYVNTTRRGPKLLALVAASALVFAACGSDDDGGSTGGGSTPSEGTTGTSDATDTTEGEAVEGADGGTLIWAHEQEPPDLHLDDPENNLSIVSWIRSPLLEGLYGISGATEYYPELLAGEPEVVENEDGTVTANFVLRDNLTWSDGDDLTADDVKFTYDAIMAADGTDEEGDPAYIYLKSDRTPGWDTITDLTVTSPTEFSITWETFFAGWKGVLSEVYPSHVFSADPATAANELNEALREWKLADGTIIPSSGPMVFDSWEKGVQMNLVRNDNYAGSNSPDAENKGTAYVDGVQINFVTDTDAQINALKAGEAQIVMTQPQLAFEDLAATEGFTVSSSAGPVYEHWGLNTQNVHLKKPEVREALAFAMNKAEVMEGLYTPLFGDSLPAEGLGNTYWLSNQSAYVDHAGEAGYGQGDVESAAAALESAGYTLNADGIYEHPEDGVLTLRVGTTGGNRLREIQQELIQAQMKDAGIDIVIDNVEGADYFSAQPFSEDGLLCSSSGGAEGNCGVWDIAQFAWVGGPWPGGNSPNFDTGIGESPYGWTSAAFIAKSAECDSTVDDDARADCYNELDKFVTTLEADPTGLFLLPITQKPSFYGYTSSLAKAGVAPDAQGAGPLTNVGDFQFAN
jgi:peptide/nickel transport system substrate-binding protein